jgi:hypothetical protein
MAWRRVGFSVEVGLAVPVPASRKVSQRIDQAPKSPRSSDESIAGDIYGSTPGLSGIRAQGAAQMFSSELRPAAGDFQQNHR